MSRGLHFSPNNPSHVSGIIILLAATLDIAKMINMTNSADLIGCDTAEIRDTWRCRGYGAAACTLAPCVRVHNATVNAGQLEEQLLSQSDSPLGIADNATEPSHNIDPNPISSFSIVDTQCLSLEQKGGLEQRGLQIDGSSRWIPFNFTTKADGTLGGYNQTKYSVVGLQFNGNKSISDAYRFIEEWDPLIASLLIDSCLYLMDQPFAIRIMFDLFENSLYGFVNPISSASDIENFTFGPFTGPSILLSIYNNSYMDGDGVQNTFANLSDMATAWVRAHGQLMYSAPAKGTILHYATCISAQWSWLAFPVFLALFSPLFFALVVLLTKRHETPIWKDLPLVWFMQDLGVTGEATIESMEERSKDFTITLLQAHEAKIEIGGARDEGKGERV